MSRDTFESLTNDFSEIMKNLNNPEYNKSSLLEEIDDYMLKSKSLGSVMKDKKHTLDLRSGILSNIKIGLVNKLELENKENLHNKSSK